MSRRSSLYREIFERIKRKYGIEKWSVESIEKLREEFFNKSASDVAGAIGLDPNKKSVKRIVSDVVGLFSKSPPQKVLLYFFEGKGKETVLSKLVDEIAGDVGRDVLKSLWEESYSLLRKPPEQKVSEKLPLKDQVLGMLGVDHEIDLRPHHIPKIHDIRGPDVSASSIRKRDYLPKLKKRLVYIANKNRMLDEIFELVKKKMPDLPYHNIDHVRDVFENTKKIIKMRGERIKYNVSFPILLASILHDVAYADGFEDHESRSAEYARETLSEFWKRGYKVNSDLVARYIELTNPEKVCRSAGGGILRDADLGYLGYPWPEFKKRIDALREEWESFGKRFSDEEWLKLQVDFLSKHRWHTGEAKQLWEENKIKNLLRLKTQLKNLAEKHPRKFK